MRVVPHDPIELSLGLPPLELEAGAIVADHRTAGWMWSSEADVARLRQELPLDAAVETIVLVHPLTATPKFHGDDGFWSALAGPGRPLRPWAHRILSFNLLGSCFGSSGPLDVGFPKRVQDARFEPPTKVLRGDLGFDETTLPATVTPFDQARSIAAALDALGLARVRLIAGGSLGGMVAQCFGWLFPERVHTVLTVAAPAASTASMIGWNHVAREAILRDPTYPAARTGLSVARQIARMTYRSPGALELRQGRRTAGPSHEVSGAFSPRMPYRIASYLRFHGDAFAETFAAPSYVCLTLAMDHHDLSRQPPARGNALRGLRLMDVRLDTDTLVSEGGQGAMRELFRGEGAVVREERLATPYGHDGFLTEGGALLRGPLLAALRPS
jgi:homoserine O-acetyltransferase